MTMLKNREKIIKRIGDSAGIILNSEERKMYDLNIGDIVEVSIRKRVDTE